MFDPAVFCDRCVVYLFSFGCVLLGYLTFEPRLSEIRGEKPPGEACLKVSSCNLYWKTVYLSLVHTEF